MKIKVSEAPLNMLNLLVAKCEGITVVDSRNRHLANDDDYVVFYDTIHRNNNGCDEYSPSIDWSQGGPIIERESITLRTNACASGHWAAFIDFGSSNTNIKARQSGPTPLVAAMRCYVASKLGDEVEIPEELA